jgi:transglutaminase-like putative cysteine protease
MGYPRTVYMRAIGVSVFLLITISIFSQNREFYSQLRKKYASENAVYVIRSENAVVKIENNLPVIYSNIYEELLLLTDQASDYSGKEIYWANFSSIENIDAHSVIPDGDKYKTIKVKEFKPTNEIAEGEFYDDEKAYKFSYPGLVNGAREVLSYTERISDPHLFGRFFFKIFEPAEESEYSVTVPTGVKIRYKLFNANDSAVKFTMKQEEQNTIYTWTMHAPEKLKFDESAPNVSYYAPHIVVLLDSYTINGVEKKVLSDTNALYDWFYSMVKHVDTAISPGVKKLVDSITDGAAGNLEKAKRIFYWVEDNITYVAYEDSLGGFTPREASLVCSRRFGDCKDMASTLVEMMRVAGLKAYQTWIGTRDIAYSFREVPSPMATNHMICAYIENGRTYFLDATAKYAPFNLVTSMIQGKEAMVGFGADKYEIVKVPILDTDKNELIDSTRLIIDNSQIRGDGNFTAKGYAKVDISEELLNYENKEKKNLLVALLGKGNNSFRIDSSSFQNIADKDKDLNIQYKFEINNYIQRDDKDVYVNMLLSKKYQSDLIENDRQAPREFEYKNIDKSINVLQIPEGYKVSSIPDSSSYTNPMFGFKINYRLKGQTLICQSYIYVNTLMLNAADFGQWNKMIHQLSKAYNETVTLTKE